MGKANGQFRIRRKLELTQIRDHALLNTPQSLRIAVVAHTELLREPDYKHTDEYSFMREVDNPSPDLNLRSIARKHLIGAR